MNLQGCDYQIRGMDLIGNVCEYRPAGYQVRKVEGGEAAWYASKNEAVGLGRDASPSSDKALFFQSSCGSCVKRRSSDFTDLGARVFPQTSRHHPNI